MIWTRRSFLVWSGAAIGIALGHPLLRLVDTNQFLVTGLSLYNDTDTLKHLTIARAHADVLLNLWVVPRTCFSWGAAPGREVNGPLENRSDCDVELLRVDFQVNKHMYIWTANSGVESLRSNSPSVASPFVQE